MDFERYANSKLYAFFDILYKLMMINLIWFLVTVVGLGIFTILPITVTLYILISSVISETEFPILKATWKVFKRNYWKAEKVFLIYLIIGIILYFNVTTYYYQVINGQSFLNSFGFWITSVLIFIFLLNFMQIVFIFLFFPHLKTLQMVKYAFLFSLAFPIRSVILLIIHILALLLIYLIPYLMPLTFLILESIVAYFSIKIMKPRYLKILKDKKPVEVSDYID